MNLVLGDQLFCDVIEFTCLRTPLSAGGTHSSIEENVTALFASIGIELIAYDTAIRTPIIAVQRGNDANGSPVEALVHSIHIRLMGKAWLRNLHG